MILPSLPGPHSWCSLSTSACAACSPQTWPVHSSGWQVPPDPGMVRPQVPLPSFPQPQDWPCGPLHRSQKRLTTCCEKNRRKILKPPRRVQLEILKTILQEKCYEKEKENWSQRCPKKAWPNFSVKKQGSALSQEQVQGKMVALITNGKWMNKSFFEKKKKKKWRKKKQKTSSSTRVQGRWSGASWRWESGGVKREKWPMVLLEALLICPHSIPKVSTSGAWNQWQKPESQDPLGLDLLDLLDLHIV